MYMIQYEKGIEVIWQWKKNNINLNTPRRRVQYKIHLTHYDRRSPVYHWGSF